MQDGLTRWLLNPSGLTPHGFCLSWDPRLVWLYATSDVGIGVAYFTIPFGLIAIVRRRPDLLFRPVFGLFAAFILLCGAGHWLDLLTLWVPAYGLQGLVKAATAAISILTAIVLFRLLPYALALPTHAQLRKIESDLLDVTQAGKQLAATAKQAADARDELASELSRRAATEAALRDSEERLRLVLHSGLAEALYLLDPDGNVESWNVSAERINGYASAEIIGRNFATFFTPEDVADNEPARLLTNARDNGHVTTEAWQVRKDGSRFLARGAIDAIRRDDGTLRGFVKVTLDVTNQRINEEQRAVIVEAAPNGMMIVDEAGVITLANSEVGRIFDYPNGALVGLSVETLVPEGFRIKHGVLRSAFTTGRSDQGMTPQRQFTGRKRDGSPVTIEIMLSPVKTPRGRIVVASLFDVTDRVRQAAERQEAEAREHIAAAATNARLDHLSQNLAKARDRAEQASESKSRFLAGITHELRTPLHGILGYAELLSLEGGLNQIQSERLEAMMASGQHLLGMINAVLDMSQIEADQLELQPVEFELLDLVRICLDVVRPAAEVKGLKLVMAPAEPHRLRTDPTRLRQVLINLLGNAVKFTATGVIEMRLRQTLSGACIRLEVADSGPGIRPMHRGKLFHTFERLNAEAVSGFEGAGLGLAIAQRLTQLMGGQIGYDDNPGGGSVFWVELPLSGTATNDAGDTARPVHGASPHLRVLVVDDEALNRNIAHGFLVAAGHSAVCVESGAAAVAMAMAEPFDVILMDVRMPGMNGLEATRQIRGLPAPRNQVRVVAVTAHAFTQQIEICRQAGMDGHVSKPFKQAVLLAALENPAPAPADMAIAASPPVTASAAAAAELPVLDRAAFEDMTAALSAVDLEEHLRTLITYSETLLRGLRMPGLPDRAGELAEAAHRVAGGAGTFGFLRVAAAARSFELAAQTNAPDTAALADHFAAAIEVSMTCARQELAAAAAVAGSRSQV